MHVCVCVLIILVSLVVGLLRPEATLRTYARTFALVPLTKSYYYRYYYLFLLL